MSELLKPFSLEGKVVMVTGASSGFGEHFAHVLGEAGAKVVLTARRAEVLQSVCDDVASKGGAAIAVPMDVTDSASIKDAFDEAESHFGLVTVVINNAGITLPSKLLDITDDNWNAVVNTNLNGVAFVTREAGKRLVAANCGGSIVNIASITADRLQSFLTPYSAAKAGVVQFTKAAALEFAPHNIRVNALCPGYFKTPLLRDWFETEDGKALINRVPTKRIGELHELNGPLLLLASEAGSLMTGASITVDGGHVLSEL